MACGISVPQPGLEPRPLQWKCQILTTGPCNAGDAETWVQFLDLEDPLEEEMATRSSNFGQKTLWTEEPGELQSMVSQKSGTWLNNWITTRNPFK